MVFHTYHDCAMDCKRLVAYVRIEGKWTPIGHFGIVCKQFELLDLAKEEEDIRSRQKLLEIKSRVKQIRKEANESITKIRNGVNAKANLFGVDLESFCSAKDDNDA
ncbi:hypothetical protein [Candidatus Nitrosotenuis cloacae]|uniref:hypothetical protein n=1 Tax=Candidatus Nitrosotenuis cloacae TaxID=1603555 RepID=UPI00228154AD|nr:hypothetical protein [Candidatus Nitrosotenuis cloacae]